MEDPGFVVGFQGILVDPGENLTMTITPDGRELSFTASQDGETPTIFITIATSHKEPSSAVALTLQGSNRQLISTSTGVASCET